MASQWYVRKGSKQYGPFSAATMKQYAAQAKIKPDDRVKQGEDGGWLVAAKVKGLFDTATTAKPAPPSSVPVEAPPNLPSVGAQAAAPGHTEAEGIWSGHRALLLGSIAASALIFLIFLIFLCLSPASPETQSSIEADPGASFKVFAARLFKELSANPITDAIEMEIGSFGEQTLREGESAVRGKYAHFAEMHDNSPTGSIRFDLRDKGKDTIDYQIEVGFTAKAGKWQATVFRFDGRHKAGNEAVDTLMSDVGSSLSSWVNDAMKKFQ
ncbi:MAG: DUF4339 domain-containing protein [Planctomycetes bacterium]|nr:DUF4339 domain-containing protein [Planctomycetota bacterium]